MKVLVTNDDGINSEGLRLLAIELEKLYDVVVIAPDSEKSACSHGITLRESMVLEEVKLEGFKGKAYSLSGTPADCVRAGLEAMYKGQIDIVFSGTNKGYNAGVDVIYSGTVSACAEANVYNKPGVAVSAQYKDGESEFSLAAKYAVEIFEKYKDIVLDNKMVLNINVPKVSEEDLAGYAVCELGEMVYDTFSVEDISDTKKLIHLKERVFTDAKAHTDRDFLKRGYISITPIEYIFGTPDLIDKFRKI